MTIEEMHIAVNLGVQKIASFQVDNLLPQEIDHELNDAMDAFIKQRYYPMGNKYRKGFEQSQKRIDDLRALVVDARLKCFYIGETISGFYADRAPLPSDYMFLVNALSENYYICNAAVDFDEETIVYYTFNISLTPPSPGLILTALKFDEADLITNENGMSLEYLSNIQNYSSTYMAGVAPVGSNPKTSQSPFNSILSTASTADYNLQVFAETTLTPVSDSNTLMLLTTYASASAIVAHWTHPVTEVVTTVSYPYPADSETFKYRKYKESGAAQKEKMSFVQHDDLYSLLSDPFNTTTYDKIKYTIQENFIDVHSDETFFTTFVDIKYIRQPKRMNKTLGVGCELAPHTHNEIVEMAIQSILEAISDPRYNTQSREVLGSE